MAVERYVTITDLATLTGSAPTTCRQRLETLEPMVRKGASDNRKRYDAREALPLVYQIENPHTDRLDLSRERAELAREQRKRVALDVLRLEGELLHADDVMDTWSACMANFKAKLRAIPQRLAKIAIAATTVREIEDEIRTEIDSALEELRGGYSVPGGANAKAAAGADRRRMGSRTPPAVA